MAFKCRAENPETVRFCLDFRARLGIPEIPRRLVTRTLETTTDKLARGVVLDGRYQFIEDLGRGGMAKVCRVLAEKIVSS